MTSGNRGKNGFCPKDSQKKKKRRLHAIRRQEMQNPCGDVRSIHDLALRSATHPQVPSPDVWVAMFVLRLGQWLG